MDGETENIVRIAPINAGSIMPSIERKLCEGMGYEYCVLFSKARMAIAYYVALCMPTLPKFLPSNICPALANAYGDHVVFMPVRAENGLAQDIPAVQLYGFRQEGERVLEIDPLMTGWRRNADCRSTIISFGYSKTIDLGYGGALLTNNKYLFDDMGPYSNWSRDDKTEQLDYELDRLDEVIKRRKERLALWDRHLPGWCIKPDIEPVMPWRVIRRITRMRDHVAKVMRNSGFSVGTNYPPLPGCTDPSSVSWGREVINFWLDDGPVAAREVLDRAVGL
jgi:hypothetical protein